MCLKRFLIIVCLLWLGGCQPANPPLVITATPFQPMPPTATITANQSDPHKLLTATAPAPDLTIESWWGLNFSKESQPIDLTVSASGSSPLVIRFRTGWPCEYANHRACASIYPTRGVPILLVTVHSGLWGEAEPLRNYLEGMGLNRAALPLQQIRQNLLDLRGRPVTLEQGGVGGSWLRVKAAVRVPPDMLESYFAQPVPAALEQVSSLDVDFAGALADPLIIIETCGWRHPDEAWLPELSDTSASIYLLAIGRE